ncbi:MAG TPA: polymorphic toxin type 23 domain-containing protein [Saprospiraceae bacterium]|nr:polymorphic toxin type 23 domain-containing protein [Saprospiraceae bacterium]
MKRVILFLIFSFLYHSKNQAQNPPEPDSKLIGDLYGSLGINVQFNYGGGIHFPGIKAYIGIGTCKTTKDKKWMVSSFINLGIYNKSLGNSLVLLNQDNQIDLTTSVYFGRIWQSGLHKYYKNIRTINNLPIYQIRSDAKALAMIGVNFILNNNGRNQTVGGIAANYDRVSISYYNDGGVPFDKLGLGDQFDRYWTGGANIFIHDSQRTNLLELSYDQFTGYQKQYYELATKLGMDVQDYSIFFSLDSTLREDKIKNINVKHVRNFYNCSSYNLRCFVTPGFALNFGVLGNLKHTSRYSRKERIFGIQDIIHYKLKMGFHPNYALNRFYASFHFHSNYNFN